MPKLLPWVMMPSEWIEDGNLQSFRWGGVEGSNNIAALMVLAPILHHMDREDGISAITYDRLALATSLSRSKISAGLKLLIRRDIIQRVDDQRSTYLVQSFDKTAGWAKFPCEKLYGDGSVVFFREFHLRRRVELDALKLWYLFASRRDNDVNLAKVTYDRISDMTGISRDNIKTGISFLAANSMVHVEHLPSRHSEYGIANAYRLPQLVPGRHMGNVGRGISVYDEVTNL